MSTKRKYTYIVAYLNRDQKPVRYHFGTYAHTCKFTDNLVKHHLDFAVYEDHKDFVEPRCIYFVGKEVSAY